MVLLVASSLITYQLGAVVPAAAAAGAAGSSGAWFHATSYPIPDIATTVAVGALTSASSLDIVTGDSNGNVSVLINNGTGIFSAPVAYHVTASPYKVVGVAIGDMNGDHAADIVAAVNDGGATGIAVLLGNGDGTFQSPIYTPVGVGSGDAPTALAVGDFNHDGHLDVAVGYYPGGANPTVVRVFAGDGAGQFAQLGGAYYIDNTYGSVARLLAVDLTGDGFLDLVASNNACGYNHGVVSVLVNQGTGLFTGTQSGLVCPANVAEGDFNNDHIPDLATTTGVVLQSGRLATLWLGKGDGTFPTTNTSTFGNNPGTVVAGDFNRDGNLDLIAADGTNLVFGAGNGDGTFQPSTLFPDGSTNVDVAVGDLNGDGNPDLVTVGSDVTVLLNQEPASGQALIAGAVQGPNGPFAGAPVEACPTVGGACIVASAPTDAQGRYDIPVSPGTYAVTTLPPAASALGTRTLGPVTVQGVTVVDFNILQPLPPTGTLTTPNGTQRAGVPSVGWGDPSTYTVTGCIGGFGVLNVRATNTTTGQVEVRAVPLTETPPGSGKYVGQIPALAPLHGLASVSQSITCPGHSSILPDGGALAGGTTVLLAGSGFTGARGVLFGATPASSFKVLQDNLISAVSPPGSGAVSVTVTNALGVALPIGAFTYFEVTSISPNAGPAAGGGQAITITGQGFTNVKQVIFGLVPASSFTVISPSQIQAVPPAGVGTVDVQVLNGFAISQAVLADYYTYQGGPVGTASIVEGIGDAAPAQLAAQLAGTSLCQTASSQSGISFTLLCDYVNEQLTSVTGSGPIGVLAQVGVIAILTLAVGVIGLPADFVGLGVGIGFLAFGLLKLACAQGCDIFGLKIDPSGSVVDTTGNPVDGATVTLLAQGGSAGSFSAVPPSSALIDPAANPETTGVSGGFEWEAVAGTYEVQASAPGCNSPGNPSQPNVTGPPFTLPPPAVGLFLTLECPGTTRPTPVVTSLSQNVGDGSGGDQVQIEGTGLTGASAVHFGAAAASAVTAISPYAVVAVAPPGSGTLDVSVTTPGGTSPPSSLDQYTYVSIPSSPQAPTISSISPNNGPVTGGTAVTITGTNLDGVFGISFGGIPSPLVTSTSATQVTATAPAALLAGPVDISVTSGQGVSPRSSGDIYTYGAPGGALKSPTVTTISSSLNPSVFGQSVTFTALTTSAAGTPSGTVTFSDGANALPGCINVALGGPGGNTATCSTSVLSAAASPHTVTASYGGTATFDVSQASASQTVTPAILSVDAQDASKVYGAASPVLGYGLSGFVNGDNATVVTGAAVCQILAPVATSAGSYPGAILCDQGTLSASNYTFTTGRTGTLVITQALLTLIPDDQSITYGDPLPSLTSNLSGFATGETLTTSGVTGSADCATSATSQSPAGSYPITCTLGSLAAANYTFATFRAGTLTVTPRSATIGYTGTLFASTGSATATTAPTVTLQAQVTAAPGGTPDLTKATVVFLLYKSTNLTMDPSAPDLKCTTTPSAQGVASCTLTNVPVDNWTVISTIQPAKGYFTASNADPVVLAVYRPIAGKFAIGSGWVTDPSYQNKPVAIATKNHRGHFGFYVHYQSGTTPGGQAAYAFHGADGLNYVIRTYSWLGGWLAFNANVVSFSAKCSVTVFDPATGKKVPMLGGGNFTCRVDATDNAQARISDTYALSVYTAAGTLYHQVGTASAQLPIGAGKVLVYKR